MSFRDNLQHLRATRNMTQEQLAMLLGVSRQSVSKWEAERAYPEMDKLLKICDLFDCSLDDLVSGDLTSRPTDVARSVPAGAVPTDVTGYDDAMRRFANRLPIGIALCIIGLAFAALLEGACPFANADPDAFSVAALFIGVGVGLAFIIPAGIERAAFQKAHPFVEDFYTTDQKETVRKMFSTGLVIGIGIGLIAIIVLVFIAGNGETSTSSVVILGSQTPPGLTFSSGGTEAWSGFVFFMLVAVGVWLIVRSSLLYGRCDLAAYNHDSLANMDTSQIEALDDPMLRQRARDARNEGGIYGAIMSIATAVGLVLLFVPAFHAAAWFWVVWPVGGILCGAVGAMRKAK